MTSQLEIQSALDAARVALSGELTEHSDFSPVRSLTAPRIVFDLRGVRRINSCGVREWIRLMEALRESGRAMELEHCSVAFVSQMNMIVNFSGGARVRSFYVPYLCVRCSAEHAELCELRDAPAVHPTAVCPVCGGEAEFDDLPEAYLAFAQSA